jgi:hypothetical protein
MSQNGRIMISFLHKIYKGAQHTGAQRRSCLAPSHDVFVSQLLCNFLLISCLFVFFIRFATINHLIYKCYISRGVRHRVCSGHLPPFFGTVYQEISCCSIGTARGASVAYCCHVHCCSTCCSSLSWTCIVVCHPSVASSRCFEVQW